MKKTEISSRQSSQYDKIIKENLEVTLPAIISEVLGLDIRISEELPHDIQHTKERRTDALRKVTDSAGDTYVLQIEFQLNDESDMVFRMAEYYIMLMRKYKLPIKQFVLFLDEGAPDMPRFLDAEDLKFGFRLVRISEVNYKLFLKSVSPEVKMLAILADLGKGELSIPIESIVSEIYQHTKSEFSKSVLFKQLRIFAQLRKNVIPKLENIMESVSTFFKEEDDFLYRRGEKKGFLKGEEKGFLKGEETGFIKGMHIKDYEMVKNLISSLALKDTEIATIVGVTESFVQQVRRQLSSGTDEDR